MTQKEITNLSYAITGFAIKVHKKLGPSLLESIYEQCMIYELRQSGFKVEQQKQVTIKYGDLEFDTTLRCDLIVDDCIVLELKSVESLLPIHQAQLLTYMKLLQMPQGLLINFNTTNITRTLKPLVNEYFSKLDS